MNRLITFTYRRTCGHCGIKHNEPVAKCISCQRVFADGHKDARSYECSHKPGDIIHSRDGRTYRVRADCSLKRVK